MNQEMNDYETGKQKKKSIQEITSYAQGKEQSATCRLKKSCRVSAAATNNYR